ncbi:MAG: contact-dependent growth inhibition system immunity protein [Isosphaeraceae bacterium]
MTKQAVAYSKDQVYYIHASSRTTAGMWIATPPFLKVAADGDVKALGDAILQALNASTDPVPQPTNWSGLIAPLLELAGVKSWGTFMRRAKCLEVGMDGEKLRLTPNRNLGSKEGFEASPSKAVELPVTSSPEQVGTAVEEAMNRCE